MEFVFSPNLPQGKVAIAAVSAEHFSILSALKRHDVKYINITPYPGLAAPVQTHADMLFHHLGGGKIIAAAPESPYARELTQLGFEVIPLAQGLHNSYPKDTALNAARIGHILLCGHHVAPEIAAYCGATDIKIIQVKQGYARCSTAIVSANAVMTADRSIAQACEKNGVEVLLLQQGHIRLDGYPYGFIGGCCGLIDKDVLAFTGNIFMHSDGERMADFMRRHHVKFLSLTDEMLTDVGGILPLFCR